EANRISRDPVFPYATHRAACAAAPRSRCPRNGPLTPWRLRPRFSRLHFQVFWCVFPPATTVLGGSGVMVKTVGQTMQSAIGQTPTGCGDICDSSKQGCLLPKFDHIRHAAHTGCQRRADLNL